MRAITYSAEPLPTGGGSTRSVIRRHRLDLHTMAHTVGAQWRRVCIGAGLCHTVSNATGGCEVTPEVTHVHQCAGSTVLTVCLLPGQLPGDVSRVVERLAFGMGAHAVRVRPFRAGYVRVVLLNADPLAGAPSMVAPVRSVLDPVTVGFDESGDPVALDLATAAHLIIQGATGSGKSVALYSLLSQLAVAPDVRITGVDPTGLVLAPWAGSDAATFPPALGTLDPLAYVLFLDRVVAEMDRRTSSMPPGRDTVELDATCPVVVVVLEEHPGALRILDGRDPAAGKRYRALVGRLLAEGRKTGIRVVLCTQRADAAIVDAFERGQASHRVSFRVDSIDGLRRLHPDLAPELAAQHAAVLPGVALATMPGRPLVRLRAPFISYAGYCAEVAGRFGRCDRTGHRPITGRVGAPGSTAAVGQPVGPRSAVEAGVARLVGRPATGPGQAGSAPRPVA